MSDWGMKIRGNVTSGQVDKVPYWDANKLEQGRGAALTPSPLKFFPRTYSLHSFT